nr:MAG TPA: hypothetical protein [Caudoviricetes sp.]DAV08731.1 MAG TPA: hypothetical protein [Caudoviricetes sp.]
MKVSHFLPELPVPFISFTTGCLVYKSLIIDNLFYERSHNYYCFNRLLNAN